MLPFVFLFNSREDNFFTFYLSMLLFVCTVFSGLPPVACSACENRTVLLLLAVIFLYELKIKGWI